MSDELKVGQLVEKRWTSAKLLKNRAGLVAEVMPREMYSSKVVVRWPNGKREQIESHRLVSYEEKIRRAERAIEQMQEQVTAAKENLLKIKKDQDLARFLMGVGT